MRSEFLAWILLVPRMLGLKRWGISLTGIIGAAAILALVPLSLEWRLLLTWVWLGSPPVFMPIIPWSIRLNIGQPLEPHDLFGDGDGEEHELQGALQRVQSEVERVMTANKE